MLHKPRSGDSACYASGDGQITLLGNVSSAEAQEDYMNVTLTRDLVTTHVTLLCGNSLVGGICLRSRHSDSTCTIERYTVNILFIFEHNSKVVKDLISCWIYLLMLQQMLGKTRSAAIKGLPRSVDMGDISCLSERTDCRHGAVLRVQPTARVNWFGRFSREQLSHSYC